MGAKNAKSPLETKEKKKKDNDVIVRGDNITNNDDIPIKNDNITNNDDMPIKNDNITNNDDIPIKNDNININNNIPIKNDNFTVNNNTLIENDDAYNNNLQNYIKSSYIIKEIFSLISENQKLELIIYNKHLQKLFDINIEDYKKKSKKYRIIDKKGFGKEYKLNTKFILFQGHYLKKKRNGIGNFMKTEN